MEMSSVSLYLSLTKRSFFSFFVKLSLFFFSLDNSKLLLITFLYPNRFFFQATGAKFAYSQSVV